MTFGDGYLFDRYTGGIGSYSVPLVNVTFEGHLVGSSQMSEATPQVKYPHGCFIYDRP